MIKLKQLYLYIAERMLYFSRPVTEIQGCLLTAGDKQDDIIQSVVKTARGALGRCQTNEEVRDVCKRIHLYLALNTDAKWPREIENLESVSSCVGMSQQLSLDCFITIVRYELIGLINDRLLSLSLGLYYLRN